MFTPGVLLATLCKLLIQRLRLWPMSISELLFAAKPAAPSDGRRGFLTGSVRTMRRLESALHVLILDVIVRRRARDVVRWLEVYLCSIWTEVSRGWQARLRTLSLIVVICRHSSYVIGCLVQQSRRISSLGGKICRKPVTHALSLASAS